MSHRVSLTENVEGGESGKEEGGFPKIPPVVKTPQIISSETLDLPYPIF